MPLQSLSPEVEKEGPGIRTALSQTEKHYQIHKRKHTLPLSVPSEANEIELTILRPVPDNLPTTSLLNFVGVWEGWRSKVVGVWNRWCVEEVEVKGHGCVGGLGGQIMVSPS